MNSIILFFCGGVGEGVGWKRGLGTSSIIVTDVEVSAFSECLLFLYNVTQRKVFIFIHLFALTRNNMQHTDRIVGSTLSWSLSISVGVINIIKGGLTVSL